MGKACPDHDKPQPDCIHCQNVIKIRRGAKTGKITLAPQTLVDNVYQDEMVKIRAGLDAISDGLWGGSLLTDESSISDFGLDRETLHQLGQAIGVPVYAEDYFIDICKRLREQS